MDRDTDYKESMEYVYNRTCFDQYYLDFHDAMRESELSLPMHYMRSPQLSSRRKLIELAKTLCAERCLSRTTLHLSRYLMDGFMDSFRVADERMQLFVCACVLLAAKIEEKTELVPRFGEVQRFLDAPIQPKEYTIFECMILNTMHWRVNVPTAATFVEYYIVGAITTRDLPIRLRGRPGQMRSQTYSELRLRMYNLVYFLLDLSLNSVEFIRVLPSKLAASVILCARYILSYRPFWTPELNQITGYVMEEVFAVAKHIRKQYIADSEMTTSGLLKRTCPFTDDPNPGKRLHE